MYFRDKNALENVLRIRTVLVLLCFRYIDMPVRRHIQDENSPRLSSSLQPTSASSAFFQSGSHSTSPNLTAQSDSDFQTNKKSKIKKKVRKYIV